MRITSYGARMYNQDKAEALRRLAGVIDVHRCVVMPAWQYDSELTDGCFIVGVHKNGEVKGAVAPIANDLMQVTAFLNGVAVGQRKQKEDE